MLLGVQRDVMTRRQKFPRFRTSALSWHSTVDTKTFLLETAPDLDMAFFLFPEQTLGVTSAVSSTSIQCVTPPPPTGHVSVTRRNGNALLKVARILDTSRITLCSSCRGVVLHFTR